MSEAATPIQVDVGAPPAGLRGRRGSCGGAPRDHDSMLAITCFTRV